MTDPLRDDSEKFARIIHLPDGLGACGNFPDMRSFHPVERMAWIWVLLNEKAERDTADDARCTLVRYDDVCRDPMNKPQALFSFCGLDWDRQTVDFIRTRTLESKATVGQDRAESERLLQHFPQSVPSGGEMEIGDEAGGC
jgi:hypothetical protein